MVTTRRHTRYLVATNAILVGLFLWATTFAADDRQGLSGSNEHLRALLTERHDVLKEMLESMELFVDNGRVDPADWCKAIIALHHAEAELCTTDTERIRVHEKLVAELRKQQEWALRRADAGRIGQWQLNEAKAATLQAQIDLERLKLGR